MANFPQLPASMPSSLAAIDYETDPLGFVQELANVVNSVFPKMKCVGKMSTLGGDPAYIVTEVINLKGSTFPVKDADKGTHNNEEDIYEAAKWRLSLRGAEEKIDAIVKKVRKLTQSSLDGYSGSIPGKKAYFDYLYGGVFFEASITPDGDETYTFGFTKEQRDVYKNETSLLRGIQREMDEKGTNEVDPFLYAETGSSHGKKLQKAIQALTGLSDLKPVRAPSHVSFTLPFVATKGRKVCHTVIFGWAKDKGWAIADIHIWVKDNPDDVLDKCSRLSFVKSAEQKDPKVPQFIHIQLKPEWVAGVPTMLNNLEDYVAQINRCL